MHERQDNAVGQVPVGALLRSAIGGDRRALARVLSRIEDGGVRTRLEIAAMLPRGASRVIGLTGAGGAGKSTLAAQLATGRDAPSPIAVLAVDPSSPSTGGALLGDRVRLGPHAPGGVFWRSMATRGSGDALAAAVPEVLAVLAACGFSTVILETAGAGQDQFGVAGLVQTLVVVVSPGFGDEVQAEKAGLMELADIVVINQRDRPGAAALHRQLTDAMAHRVPGRPGWNVPVIATQATSAEGIEELRGAIEAHGAWRRDALGPRSQGLETRELLDRIQREISGIVQLWLDEQMRAPQSLDATPITEHLEALRIGRLTPLQVALAVLTDLGSGAPSFFGLPPRLPAGERPAGADSLRPNPDRSAGGSAGEE